MYQETVKVILIAGPTASGKSALALDLAHKCKGRIINADAMQVYEGLPILAAQPSTEEMQTVPHDLYGVIDPAEASSAGKWLALARAAVDRAVKAGQTPILVGGTGLYFRAFLGGLAEIPTIPAAVREDVIALYDELGEEKFRAALAKLDPAAAKRLARNDRQRMIRAYEVAQHTGKTLDEWHASSSVTPAKAGVQKRVGASYDSNAADAAAMDSRFRGNDVQYETHLLLPPREELYAACDRRFTKMLERGAIEEVKAFLKRGLDPELPAMKTIGVREIGAYLAGTSTLEEAVTKAEQMTRNYAKRQMTWFRNQKLI